MFPEHVKSICHFITYIFQNDLIFMYIHNSHAHTYFHVSHLYAQMHSAVGEESAPNAQVCMGTRKLPCGCSSQ